MLPKCFFFTAYFFPHAFSFQLPSQTGCHHKVGTTISGSSQSLLTREGLRLGLSLKKKIPGNGSDWLSWVRLHPWANHMTNEGWARSISQTWGGGCGQSAGQVKLSVSTVFAYPPPPHFLCALLFLSAPNIFVYQHSFQYANKPFFQGDKNRILS